MLNHHWEPAEGTIANAHSQPMEMPGKHGVREVTVYDMDVRTSDGNVMEANIPSEEHRLLRPGMVVRLEINSKTAEIRLHPKSADLIIRRDGPIPSRSSDRFAAPPGAGAPDASGLDLAALFGGSFPAGAQVFITSSAGAAGPVDDENLVVDLLTQLQSGDPATVAAAREQMGQVARARRERAHAQSAGPGSGQDGAPGPADRPSPADRIAALQQMVDRGQLSQDEFDARRQRILDQI
jgi:hypothetical protein